MSAPTSRDELTTRMMHFYKTKQAARMDEDLKIYKSEQNPRIITTLGQIYKFQ
jgi:hypothetical protein